jgi:formate dehydrogenase major subunit
VPGLGTSFGRGGATTFQQDLQHADCVLIQGSSMAEAHPVGFRWVMKARERGATVIHVDPRFSRTSAMADLHVPIRAGTDIAFLGGLIRHVIETGSYFEEYVRHYTNAATLVGERFRDTEDPLDDAGAAQTSEAGRRAGGKPAGVFSGFDPETGAYDRTSWMYEGGEVASAAGFREHSTQSFEEKTGAGMLVGNAKRDETLQHPRCVFQIVRRHFARYTPEMVERICGISRQDFTHVADALVRNSGPERTTALCYAVGWTQHTAGAQMIRAGAILQLLLGNVGRPGGGVMALRGHASIQGSTDVPTLYDLLPGYLHMPRAREEEQSLEDYMASGGTSRGWWCHFPKYVVSLLKAWFGDAASEENDYGFAHLPKISGVHSHFTTMLRALDGGLDGMFVMGQNPAVGSQHAGLQRRALARLRWLVVRDLAELETATFWRDSPEVRSGELRTGEIGTEVFLMPAAAHLEKDGTFTNTQRLLQWHDKALDPPGDARSELWFMHHLAKRVKARSAEPERGRDWPIRNLRWNYPEHGPLREPDAEAVLREMNGYRVEDGEPLGGFTELAADGSTACGCWIYSGSFAGGVNQTRRREPGDGWVAPEWGWAWPANRRILYNRASADPEGRPWSERKRYVWWDADAGRWTGYDVPDFEAGKPPGYRPEGEEPEGMDAISGTDPFIMMADGRAWLYSPSGMLDGPLPTHYEPLESPVRNPLYPERGPNPAGLYWERPDNPYHPIADPRYPVVATTFRLTEHHTAGAMSRNLPWLAELQPEMFAELDPVLARARDIEDGGWMTIVTERGEIEARARVTERMRPLHIDGRPVHQVALPWHWGFGSGAPGDAANDLGALSGDPNVSIQESKAFTCDVRAGRRRRESTEPLRGAPHGAARPDRDHPAEELA